MRVSTNRQVEHDLSVPDQRAQLTSWCKAKQWEIGAEFIEPGATATDDKRRVFQQMIERACDGEHAFDVIVVHSYSRFFRDAFGQEFYLRKLAKHGVKLVSITQPLGDEDDPAQAMMRKVIALFDEYQSKENAKHVIRSMKENARQGFWNGATCPLGYRLVEVEKRGAKVKRSLAIDAVEAETIRLIYKLYLYGDGTSGALGVKEVVKWLNRNGYRTRRGQTFGVGPLHKILTNTLFIGQWKFNQASSRTRERKPAEEIIIVNVPAIIEPELFERVQQQLRARSPRVAAPRVTTGPILLTGLAVCATCGGGMTLRTGTSRSGAVHRYYTCSTQARKGKSTCKGRSMPMGKLDSLVTNRLVEHLFHPGRLAAILSSLTARRAEKGAIAEWPDSGTAPGGDGGGRQAQAALSPDRRGGHRPGRCPQRSAQQYQGRAGPCQSRPRTRQLPCRPDHPNRSGSHRAVRQPHAPQFDKRLGALPQGLPSLNHRHRRGR
jgi:DNA invertase Pin-like site-specific DNA recombinase